MPILNDLMPFKPIYAAISSKSYQSITILSMNPGSSSIESIVFNGLDSEPIGVYEDVI